MVHEQGRVSSCNDRSTGSTSAVPIRVCFRSAFFLASLFTRAGSVVPGPVGLGLLFWPPSVGRHTAASDGSGEACTAPWPSYTPYEG